MAEVRKLSGKTVPEIILTMEYGTVTDSSNLAEAWLQNKTFSCYINGAMNEIISDGCHETKEVKDPCSGRVIATIIDSQTSDVDSVLCSSQSAHIKWKNMDGYERAKHLYSIARHLQKHVSLLVQVESLNRGVQSKDPREFDVPAAIRQFYYYAGWAQLNVAEPYLNGVVAGIMSATSPLLALAWIVAPALAAGKTVILKPSRTTPLTAYLLAELCTQSGLPPGVLNVIPGSVQVGKYLSRSNIVSNIAFCGSTAIGRQIRQDTAGMCKSLTLFLSGKTPMLVFDSADIDSAIEGVADNAWFNQGQVSWAVRTLLVQESILNTFVEKLKLRMKSIRIGNAFDKMADVGRPVHSYVVARMAEIVSEARRNGTEVFQVKLPSSLPSDSFFPLTLLIGNQAESNRVVSEDIILPFLSIIPFRTAKEAIMLANNTRYGVCASVWTEIAALALDVANQLQVGTVWINCHGVMDAGVPFSSWKQSGFGCFGGREGLLEYTFSKNMGTRVEPDEMNYNDFGTASNHQSQAVPLNACPTKDVDSTYKLYYGGAHKRPDSNSSRTVTDITGKRSETVADGNKKDIRNAVEAAVAAQPAWWKLGAHSRSQIIYNIAEKLQARKKEFISNLHKIDPKFKTEVDSSLSQLFHWAASCDKTAFTSGTATPVAGVIATTSREPLGVVGIIIDDDTCLEAFVQHIAATICYGNSVVIIPNMKYPVPAMELCQVFDTSDVPKGVINVITGDKHLLLSALTQHQDVRALWYSGNDSKSIKYVEWASSHNMKHTWVNSFPINSVSRHVYEWNATQCKAVWISSGEIFSN